MRQWIAVVVMVVAGVGMAGAVTGDLNLDGKVDFMERDSTMS